MRLFYAMTLPESVCETLAAAQAKLRGNWRPVKAEHLLITLAYLPSDMPKASEDILKKLTHLGNEIGRNHAPLELKLRGTGYHPNTGSPRVWFVKSESVKPELLEGELLEGQDPKTQDPKTHIDTLEAVAQELRAKCPVPLEDQPFKGHITLARKKGPAPRLEPLIFEDSWLATEFRLIQSTLHKSGPEYKTVKRFRFLK
jgi:RNA 2',3'-cyclic 3'-phosphodiesterase